MLNTENTALKMIAEAARCPEYSTLIASISHGAERSLNTLLSFCPKSLILWLYVNSWGRDKKGSMSIVGVEIKNK